MGTGSGLLLLLLLFATEASAGVGPPTSVPPYVNTDADEALPDEFRLTVPIVSKCCLLDQVYDVNKTCVDSNIRFRPPFGGPQPAVVEYIKGIKCSDEKYRLEPEVSHGDVYELEPDGTLVLPNRGHQRLNRSSYCLDTVLVDAANNRTESLALVCFPDVEEEPADNYPVLGVSQIGCLLSVPFLLLTAGVFLYFGELRDLRGKIAICLTLCLALAFLSLAAFRSFTNQTPLSCRLLPYVIQFSFLASFLWMNVLCINTWWYTRMGLMNRAVTVSVEGRRFLYYSMYAWSVPILWTIFTFVADSTTIITTNDSLKPQFGNPSCWFNSHIAAGIYLFGPIGAVLFLNTVFFALNTKLIFSRRRHRIDHEMVRMTWALITNRRIKLLSECLASFFMMGIFWTLELVLWLTQTTAVQLVILNDILNTLQGPVLFYLLVYRNGCARRSISGRLVPSWCRRRRPKRHDPNKAPANSASTADPTAGRRRPSPWRRRPPAAAGTVTGPHLTPNRNRALLTAG